MDQHRLAALVATSPENVLYCVEYEGKRGVWNRSDKAAIVPAEAEQRPCVVSSAGEITTLTFAGVDERAEVLVFGRQGYRFGADSDRAIRMSRMMDDKVVPSLVDGILAGLRAVGVPGGRVSVDQTGAPEVLYRLQEKESPYEFVPYGEHLFQLARMVKTPSEVDQIRRACAVNEAGAQAVLAVAADVVGHEMDRLYRTVVCSLGGYPLHWEIDTLGAFHFATQGDQPKPGDRIRWDAVCSLGGYCSDFGGTYYLRTNPPTSDLNTYNALNRGIDCAIELLKPGARASAIYTATLTAIRNSGIPDYFFPITGHGIGIQVWEYPVLREPAAITSPYIPDMFDPVLEEGMVIAIEVPKPARARGGFQNEVICVVTKDGGQMLSRRRELMVVG